MVLDNVEQLGEYEPEHGLIPCYVEIAIQGMEEPQSGIGCMIQALLFPLREQVGNKTITHIVRERAENITGLVVASRGEGKALQADHGIAAPIGEPVVPSNHCTYLVTGGMRPHGVSEATSRSNHELVCGQEQFCSKASARFGMDRIQQPLAPLVFSGQRLGWMHGTDYLPGLRRRHQCGRVVATEVNPEVAWTPEVACVLIASESLDTEQHIRNLSGLDRKRWALPIKHHTERR